MLNRNNLETIKQVTKEFFKKTTFDVEIQFLSQQDLMIPINLKSDEPKVLIGEGGQTLIEIQRLLFNFAIPVIFLCFPSVFNKKYIEVLLFKLLISTSPPSQQK